ncbi:helix-turn-helix transcriptional regulator [Tardiphaga sp.]|jgi:AraC family transcriptional activator of pyochelin receptor|uniref:helix-turn-helix transcriptional regulator n=1 Tax=Tardiphaga sp. TaxID=1926292 RepID=UPI0037DA2F86
MAQRTATIAQAGESINRPESRQYLKLFAGDLIISSGINELGAKSSGAGPLKRGLKVVVVLSGREQIELEGHPLVEISGPQSCVILNEHDSNSVRWIAGDMPLHFVIIQVAYSLALDALGIDLAAVKRQREQAEKPLLHVAKGDQVLQSLASQIVTCPMRGTMRNMYLAGKSFELVAAALDPMLRQPEREEQPFSAADLQRVHAAYDRLIADADEPPSLAELARDVGLSASKLTIGFRRAFGTTVFGVLQDHRLQEAHRMLASGEVTVSEAAYRVGYSPAHFTTIFRQRFGVSPSKLRKS